MFWGYRGNVWLNQLRAECLGLRKDSLLVFELRERTLCDMDSFHGTPRSAARWSPFAVHCMLGNFETISEVQADGVARCAGASCAVADTDAHTERRRRQ